MVLTSDNCNDIIIENNGDDILYQSGNTRLVLSYNCCDKKIIDIVDFSRLEISKQCISNSPTKFTLNINNVNSDNFQNVSYNTNISSGISVVQNNFLSYTIEISAIVRVLTLTILTDAGTTYTLSITINNPNNCDEITFSHSLSSNCGFTINSSSQITLNSNAFYLNNCTEPQVLNTGVYSVCVQNVINDIVEDESCSCIFKDCDALSCKILKDWKSNLNVFRTYMALLQASDLLNTDNSCKNYLKCSDLCEMYRYVISQTIITQPINNNDCGCNK